MTTTGCRRRRPPVYEATSATPIRRAVSCAIPAGGCTSGVAAAGTLSCVVCECVSQGVRVGVCVTDGSGCGECVTNRVRRRRSVPRAAASVCCSVSVSAAGPWDAPVAAAARVRVCVPCVVNLYRV